RELFDLVIAIKKIATMLVRVFEGGTRRGLVFTLRRSLRRASHRFSEAVRLALAVGPLDILFGVGCLLLVVSRRVHAVMQRTAAGGRVGFVRERVLKSFVRVA